MRRDHPASPIIINYNFNPSLWVLCTFGDLSVKCLKILNHIADVFAGADIEHLHLDVLLDGMEPHSSSFLTTASVNNGSTI